MFIYVVYTEFACFAYASRSMALDAIAAADAPPLIIADSGKYLHV